MDNRMKERVGKKELRKIFWRSLTIQASWNYAKQMSLAYAYCMIPALKKIYTNPEDQRAAVERHFEFFNITPHISTFVLGISVAMENENEQHDDFDEKSINLVKTALMGPLSGIGDSFFWGTFKVIAAGLGIHFALQGSLLGPVVTLLAYNIPHFLIRYNLIFLGYDAGTKYIQKILEEGLMEKVTYYASIVGLMVVGCMVATMIGLQTPLVFTSGTAEISLQADFFDKIMPQSLSLLAFGIMYYFIKKGIKINWILLGSIVAGILFAWLGIF